MPETKPQPLTEAALAEIEARHKLAQSGFQPRVEVDNSLADIPALIQTVRAAWARIDILNNLGEGMLTRLETVAGIGKKADHGWNFVVGEIERQFTALREQLAQRDTLLSDVCETEDRCRNLLAAYDCSSPEGIVPLDEVVQVVVARLAQAEKELESA